MRLYRAIEFSRLIFLLDDEGSQQFWNDRIHANQSKSFNWWLDDQSETARRQVVAHISRCCHSAFFETSMEYNAMQGGRFNPGKSFGMLYTASNPSVAALEVLFHLFADSQPIHDGMLRSSSKIGASFNVRVPDKIDVLIVVFEIEIEKEATREVCGDLDALKQDCEHIGFKRYIGSNFSRDFIFGNDYEISRILGCHLHTVQGSSTFVVPSARLDFESQDELRLRNILIPEKDLSTFSPKMTGRFAEYRCQVEMQPAAGGDHSVEVCATGQNARIAKFLLQRTPNPKKAGRQVVSYQPDVQNQKSVYSRKVVIQKFVPIPEE